MEKFTKPELLDFLCATDLEQGWQSVDGPSTPVEGDIGDIE